MTKSTITRERLEQLADNNTICKVSWDERIELAQIALAAMDSEPDRNPVLAYADSYRDMAKQGVESVPIWSVITDLERNIAPLYRHAQQPVVPDDVLAALQKVARIRLDLNDFDGDRRGIANCLGDAEEALIEVVNRRAAMLQAQPQNAPQNIPEIIPNELIAAVNRLLDSNGSRGCYNAIKCYDAHIEVERLLAAARQEVKP